MARIQFITHAGKQLLYLDFSKADVATVKATAEEAKPIIAKQPQGSVFTLTDVSDSQLTPETSAIFKDFTAHNKPYVKAGAVLGVTGLKKVIFNTVVSVQGRNLKAFSDMDEAKDWLSKQ